MQLVCLLVEEANQGVLHVRFMQAQDLLVPVVIAMPELKSLMHDYV